ncbi:MAG TPA: hypothetical protein VE990_19020 [Acidimicrobiales bacterium]|nr:hypothetical protein [Acidimicrobiales bacterium]
MLLLTVSHHTALRLGEAGALLAALGAFALLVLSLASRGPTAGGGPAAVRPVAYALMTAGFVLQIFAFHWN